VVERGGKLVGIVSRSDVVRQLCLERSLGEAMADAYRDQTDASFAAQSQGAIGGAIGQRMERLRVRDVMIQDVLTVPPDLSVGKAAQLLIERRIHRLPVVENGKLVGIVSSLDFTRIVAEAP
jgi:CBS domain-containing protein